MARRLVHDYGKTPPAVDVPRRGVNGRIYVSATALAVRRNAIQCLCVQGLTPRQIVAATGASPDSVSYELRLIRHAKAVKLH
jgi:uncharacterized Fe-S cluster-containing radical SAM superfamily protein